MANKKKGEKKKILWWVIGTLITIIAGFFINNELDLFTKRIEEKPYFAVIMTKKYPDFKIPLEFLAGFDEATQKKHFIQTPDNRVIRFKKIDDMGDINEAERIAKEIAKDDHCVLVIGNSNSTLTNKTIDVFLSHPDPPALIMPIATANEITRKADIPQYNAVLRMPPTNEIQAEFIAECAKRQTKDKAKNFHVAIYGDLENRYYSENLCRDIARAVRSKGGIIVIEELIGATNSIFSSSKVWTLSNPPEIIVFAGVIHNGLLLIDQINYLGIEKPIIFSDGCMSSDLLKNVKKLKNKVYLASPVIYNKKDPERMPTFAPYGKDVYTLLIRIFDAVDKISKKSLRKFIREKKDSISFDNGNAGAYKFNKIGNNTAANYHLYEITGGKLRYCEMH